MNKADEESEKDDSSRKNGDHYYHLLSSMCMCLKLDIFKYACICIHICSDARLENRQIVRQTYNFDTSFYAFGL